MKYDLIVASGCTDWISATQIISQNMNDLGIAISVQTPEFNTWYDTLTKGQFQWSFGVGSSGPSPYNLYRGQMSKLTLLPVGQVAENIGRYVSPDADKLLEQFAQTTDNTQQKKIMAQVEKLFVNEAPAIPLYPGPEYYEFNTKRFSGFPTATNPYAPGTPYSPTSLIVLTTLTPK